jgi:hypothetical protein
MNHEQRPTDAPDEFDAELKRMLSETEKEMTLEELRASREHAVRVLKKMQSETRFGALESRGSAIMDAHDQGGWQALCESRGRRLYLELQWWAFLYQYDLMIEWLRSGGRFTVTEAKVQSAIFRGMIFANTDWVHDQMGEDRPSGRGKML